MTDEEDRTIFKEVLPTKGMLFTESSPTVIFSKPKVLPLKSVTLEKLEKIQKEAEEKLKTGNGDRNVPPTNK